MTGTATRRKAKKGVGLAFLRNLPDTDDCVLWPYGRHTDGYGGVQYQGRGQNAHRVALILATGEDPAGMHAAHAPIICHSRPCINPRHIRWASPFENGLDRVLDGADNAGEKNPNAKLTTAAIRADTRKIHAIAADYAVYPSRVIRIRRRETWGHVAEDVPATKEDVFDVQLELEHENELADARTENYR